MSTSISKKKILLVLLVVATTFSFLYAFNKTYEYKVVSSKLKESIEEKNELQEKLEKTTANYQALSIKNKKLSKRVISEINKIINLKDSVNELDSDLQEDKKALNQKTSLTRRLSSKINDLATKIDKAKLLKINISDLITMRKRNNGKFTKTTNKNKVDAFKVSFNVLKNEIAVSGKRKVLIGLKDFQGNIVAVKGGSNNHELTIDYKNELLEIVSFLEVERENIKPGRYKVVVSINGVSTAQKTINLR